MDEVSQTLSIKILERGEGGGYTVLYSWQPVA